MKKLLSLAMCALITVTVFGQSVNLDQVELADLDLTKADLSNVEVYFAGPVDLLLTGVRYMGMSYAALLKYDGRGVVEVSVPPVSSPAGMPSALDLREATFTLVSDGIVIADVIADGYYFSGKLVPTATLDLAVSGPLSVTGVAAVPDLTDDVNRLQGEVATLRRSLGLASTERDAAKASLADAESELADAESELAQAEAEIAGLETRLRRATTTTTTTTAMTAADVVAAVNRPVKSGFGGGSAANGNWSMSGTGLRQTSVGDLYAKYVVPVQQNANELVYSFSGRGSASGWSGYGLHFLGSGSGNSRLYGFGSSYLVWVTRDPGNTQSDQTFIQLYRSYNDVKMVQIASEAIDSSIARDLDVTVYVNRSMGGIYVGVGDEVVIEYTDPAVIRSGSSVAARTLGPATINGLTVRSK